MTEYIRRHYENEIFTELERRIRCGKLGAMCEGRLLRNPDRAIQTSPLVANLLPKKGSIVWTNYRRIAECCVQAELTVEQEIEITRENSRQTVRQRYDVDMWFDMEGKIAGEYGGFRLHRCRNEKPGVKLDEYLVPVLGWEDVEEEAERIIFQLAPEGLHDPSKLKPEAFAKRLGLKIVDLPLYKRPRTSSMGYRRGKDGTPEVVEAEADVVRTIFRRFLEGATPAMISRELNLSGIPCPSRKNLLSENEAEIAKARKKTSRWGTSTVENILANEKYKGDAILQKTYCTDYLLKTFVVNDGSVVPKYYAQNSHPAIVSPEVFDLAQQELAWRRSLNGRYSGRSCFASRVVCGDCGAFYGSKVWHSTDEYRRTIWRCNNKYAGETKCATPHVTQDALEKAFVQVMQQVLSQKNAILAACHEALDEAFDTTELDKAATRLQDQALGMVARARQLVEENARVQRDQDEFKKDYEALLSEHARLNEKIQAIAKQKKDKAERRRRIEIFLHMLEEQKEYLGFEPGMFVALVDKVIIQHDGRMAFCFRNGMKCEYPQ